MVGGGEAKLSALIHALPQSAEHTTQGDPVMASMPFVHVAGGTLPPSRHPMPLPPTPPNPPSNTGPTPPAPIVVTGKPAKPPVPKVGLPPNPPKPPPSKPQSTWQLNEFSSGAQKPPQHAGQLPQSLS